MKASEVQAMLGVEDGEVFAHGYTLDRLTLDLKFIDGQVVRQTYKTDARGDKSHEETDFYEEFSWRELSERYKRFYKNATNPKLVDLVTTFGGYCSLI